MTWVTQSQLTSSTSDRAFLQLSEAYQDQPDVNALNSAEQLTSLALMHVHKDVLVNRMETVNTFSRLHPRCLQFLMCVNNVALGTVGGASVLTSFSAG